MVKDEKLLLAAARSEYERGRAWFALRLAAPLAVLPAVSFLLGTPGRSASLLGAGLVSAVALAVWRGGPVAFSGMSGFKAGLIPLFFAHCANQWGHVCTPYGCTSLCVPACAAGGVLAGLTVEWLARRGPRPQLTRGLGMIVAILTGGLGCACVGAFGLLAMIAGLAVSLLGSRLMPARA